MNIHHEKINREHTVNRYVFKGDPGAQLRHWHRNVEYIYVLKGSFILEMSGKSHSCREGDIASVECGEIHRFVYSGEECEMFICTFRPELPVKNGEESRRIKGHITAKELESKGKDKEIGELFHEMYKESNEPMIMSGNIIRADIIRLYSVFARYFPKEAGTVSRSYRGLEDFQSALSYIAENYHEKITLSDVAAEINYNPSYVSTLFVNYTGVNFKMYLDTLRINKAAELLVNTSEKITLVAMKCGYDNIRTFNSTFKRITGQTPREYRNKNNKI